MRTGHPGHRFAFGLFGAWLAAWLAACSSGGYGGSSPPPPPPAATVIAGRVVDDFVVGATVTAYPVSVGGQVGASCIQVQGACATATTDAGGNYSLNLGSYSGAVLLQSTGGTYTDTVTGQMVTIPAGQTLSVFLPSVAPGSNTITAQITAMTTIEAQFALQAMSQGVAAATAASGADTTVQSYFGLAQSVVTTGLLDLTQANCGTAASDQAQLDASLILAGFSQLASQFNVQPVALAEAIAEDATSNAGQLTGTVGGATPITVPLASGSGPAVPLATIEGSSFGQTLENAIKTFESSVRNACNAAQSAGQSSTLSADTQSVGGQQPPTYSYTLNGTLSGFAGTSPAHVRFEVVLNCPADTVAAVTGAATVNGNGAFSATVVGSTNPYVALDYTNSCNANTWTLSVSSSPGQNCGVQPVNGTFTSTDGGNTNVGTPNPTVSCSAPPPQLYNVGGQVSGLTAGKSVTLSDAGNGATLLLTGNGTFTLDTQLANGTAYDVVANNSCSVTNGAGTINGANVTNVMVSCGSGLSAAIANPHGLLFLLGTPAYLFVANAGGPSGGEVLVYSEQTNLTAFSGLTLVASITAGISQPTRLALDRNNHLYVSNGGTNTVTVYDVSSAGNIAANTIPQLTAATIGPANIQNPLGLTVDGSGNVYVASNGTAGGWVTVFSPCTTSLCTPGSFVEGATLTADGAGHSFNAPGVMTDYNGAGVGGGDFMLLGLGPSGAPNDVLLYTAPLTASSTPLYVLTNSQCATGPSGPTGIALTVTAQPEIYVSSYYSSSVAGYSFDNFLRNGVACPVPDFNSGANSAIAQPEGLAVDGIGNIFVANASANTVTVYSPGQGLALAPVYILR
ncbi:MAG: hypothetical protein KGJ68_03610 [Gammaproteobacteria bacterium]|nr:hypothetical protein [Gammaproteobacteria bacterium]